MMITALQVSVAVATPLALVEVSAGHSKIRSGGQVTTGLVMSRTVMVCTQLVLLPQASMAVQVRAMILVAPQLLVTESRYVTVTAPHPSWAVATPVAFVLVLAGQSKVTSAGQIRLGRVVSRTVTVC